MGNHSLVGSAEMFYFPFNLGRGDFVEFWTESIIRTVKNIEMDVTDNSLFTKWTQLAFAASCIEVAFVQIADAKIRDIMNAGHKMAEFSRQSALTVDQRQDIKEDSGARPRRRGMNLGLSY
jgi:hypothetical protein